VDTHKAWLSRAIDKHTGTNRLSPGWIRRRVVRSEWIWLVLGVALALLAFLTTLQTSINGSVSPYAMDTGEFQNALPHWGTVHGIGYPQYSLTGSLLVSGMRLAGIPPAAAASLVSAVWAAVGVGLFILLAHELGAPMPAAAAGAWFAALATSFWMDASLAEVHSLTTMLTFGALLFALRFGRSGGRRDLLWTTFFFTQGVIHQRSVLLIAPALLLLVAPRWRALVRHALPVVTVAALAPLTYAYVWLRIRMNAGWIFEPDLKKVLFDNQAGRLITFPSGLADWLARTRGLLGVLNHDLPLALLVVGLAALLLLTWRRRMPTWRGQMLTWRHQRREAIALTLAWLPYFGLSVLVWDGFAGDAVQALKLPLLPLAGAGLALAMGWAAKRLAAAWWAGPARLAGPVIVVLALLLLGADHYPRITAVTRDPDAERIIATAEQIAPAPGGDPVNLVALWGNQYWVLAYAQAYQGRLPGVNLIRHYQDLRGPFGQHDRLLILSESLQAAPLPYWEARLGQRVGIDVYAPGILELTSRLSGAAANAQRAAQNAYEKSYRLGTPLPAQ
jgi:hypothetical protein